MALPRCASGQNQAPDFARRRDDPAGRRARDGLRPHFKLEWFNPTSSFKDRGASGDAFVLEPVGVAAVLEDSSGNGGAAMAAYGAAGGLKVKILAPAYASPAKIAQIRAYGAEVQLIDGPREESQAEAIRQSHEIFYSSHNWQALFLEGTKSIAYEIWEDCGFVAPDNIIMPVGAGSLLLGCYLGFKELHAARQIVKVPRLYAAQPLNCSPVDASFQAGSDAPVARPVAKTIAEGTAIKEPLRLREMIMALRETGGDTVAVAEAEIIAAFHRLAHNGLLAEPTSATAAAAITGSPLAARSIPKSSPSSSHRRRRQERACDRGAGWRAALRGACGRERQ